MELFEEILLHEIKQRMTFEIDVTAIINAACYQTIQKIKAIIEDDSLEDPECFWKIKKIVCAFEDIGSTCGSRHDFG